MDVRIFKQHELVHSDKMEYVQQRQINCAFQNIFFSNVDLQMQKCLNHDNRVIFGMFFRSSLKLFDASLCIYVVKCVWLSSKFNFISELLALLYYIQGYI